MSTKLCVTTALRASATNSVTYGVLSVATAPLLVHSETKAHTFKQSAVLLTPILHPPVSTAETHVNRGRTFGDNAPTLPILKVYSRFTCHARPTELALLLRRGLRGYRLRKEDIHCRFSRSVQDGSMVQVAADNTRQGTGKLPLDGGHYKRSTSSQAAQMSKRRRYNFGGGARAQADTMRRTRDMLGLLCTSHGQAWPTATFSSVDSTKY